MVWKLLASLVLVALVVAGWYLFEGRWDRRLFSSESGGVCANLGAREAAAWLREHPETFVLDVRSEREFASGALPRATNFPIGADDFEERIAALDRSRPVLVYCAGGYRSRKAVERLKALGFENIQHLHRGHLSWRAKVGS